MYYISFVVDDALLPAAFYAGPAVRSEAKMLGTFAGVIRESCWAKKESRVQLVKKECMGTRSEEAGSMQGAGPIMIQDQVSKFCKNLAG